MRNLFFATIGVSLLVSCGDPVKENIKVEKERIPVEIADQDLFKGNLITAYLQNETKFINEANGFFLKGIDSYRNKKDFDSASYYLRHSLLKEPTAKAYFELGNLSMDQEEYDLALKAYGMAEQLNYKPFSQILYNKSCILSLKGEKEQAGRYLEYAIQAGYNNIEHLNKDPDLEELRDSYYFKKAVDKGLRGMSDAENLFWLQFKNQFPKVDLPTTIETHMTYEESEALEFISFDYEKYISEMRDEKFSREVSKGFYYYSQPYENENFVGVVYIVRDEFMGEYAPLTYRLATFSHDGTLIDKADIGGHDLYEEPIKRAELKKDFQIDITLLEAIHEKDPDEHGYYENKLVDTKEVGKLSYHINEKGKIIEEDKDMASK